MKDSQEILICPACGELMEKIYIKETNFHLDICTNGCGSILFDNQELKKFDESHEKIEDILEALKDKEFKKTDGSKQRTCPVCAAPMIKNATKVNGSYTIDECYTCGAKFLDYKELEKLRAEYRNEKDRSEDFNRYFQNEFSVEFSELDKKVEKIRAEKSFIRRAIKKLFSNDI